MGHEAICASAIVAPRSDNTESVYLAHDNANTSHAADPQCASLEHDASTLTAQHDSDARPEEVCALEAEIGPGVLLVEGDGSHAPYCC
jgi:hypothetical protein